LNASLSSIFETIVTVVLYHTLYCHSFDSTFIHSSHPFQPLILPTQHSKPFVTMLGRTIFTTAFFALASFAVASPPGCLLGAVNTYDAPSDMKAVCSEKDAAKTIQKFCGDSAQEAMEAFADICNSAGVKVCKYTR
jgi:hypothetical protein